MHSVQFDSINDSIQFHSIQFNSFQFISFQFNSIQFNSIQFISISIQYTVYLPKQQFMPSSFTLHNASVHLWWVCIIFIHNNLSLFFCFSVRSLHGFHLLLRLHLSRNSQRCQPGSSCSPFSPGWTIRQFALPGGRQLRHTLVAILWINTVRHGCFASR